MARTLNFYTDASASTKRGLGAIFMNHWISQKWESGFIENANPSIGFLELYALVVGIYAWGHHEEMKNTRVIIFCDNLLVCRMVNNLSSKFSRCMYLIRMLTLRNLMDNRRVFVRHVLSFKNTCADAL